MKTWKAAAGAAGLALILAACGGNSVETVDSSPTPAPTEAVTEVTEPTPEPESPQVEGEIDLGVVQAKVGDFVVIPVPRAILQSQDVSEWNFTRTFDDIFAEPAPGITDEDSTASRITFGEFDEDSISSSLEIIKPGKGTVTITYTVPDTGENVEITGTVEASE
jgi:hypothetical protein